MFFWFKVLLSSLIIAGVSQIAQYNKLLAAFLISLPTISILSFIWIYIDARDPKQIIELSYSVFWLFFPSLLLFISLPLFLKHGLNFTVSMILSCVLMTSGYAICMYLKSVLWK